MGPSRKAWLGSWVAPRAGIGFSSFCHFLQSPAAPGHCINKCLGRYTSKKKHKYCTRERIPSPRPPTAPRKPSKYCTWHSPAPWGPGPAVSLVEAPGTEVLGSPLTPPPHPHHDWEHGSSQRIGKGLGPLATGVPSGMLLQGWEEPMQAQVCPWLGTPGQSLCVG